MTPDETFPVVLSLRVALLALLLVAPIGTCTALVQARARYRLRRVVDAVILLPLVLPPSVIGFFLVILFGRNGTLGRALEDTLGIRIIFTPWAAVVASAVVAFPILVKTAQPAFESVPSELEGVASTLGLAPVEVFLRVTMPCAWRGVLAAIVLGFARALGEFGATLMFAGNVPGRTNTMPLEIFAAYEMGDDRRALFYVAILMALSFAVVLFAGALAPRAWTLTR
jgi:molybdate transport system permease protein